MKYRSKIDLIAQMLQVASEGPVLKTKMMYGALLSQTQLKGLLSLTLNAELLVYNEKEQTYQTTQKGLHFLERYNELSNLLSTLPSQ
ncbi:MAG TPA: winged helix-turn-helix domain-containing protein [Nitrososphaeraceae archaeon]|nr:winged helix-turn-helix domain-containing protein [Nitrososphaeraceae archaeon]